KNDTTTPVKDWDAQPIPGKELRVFPEDTDIPKDQINTKIDETFVSRGQVKLPSAGKFAEWKRGLLEELRAYSFRPFPERIPPAAGVLEGEGLFGIMTVVTEPGIQLDGVLAQSIWKDSTTAWLVVHDSDTKGKGVPEPVRKLFGPKDAVTILVPRG